VYTPGKPCPVDLVWRCAGPPADLPIECDLKFQLHDQPDGGRAEVAGRIVSLFVPSMTRGVGRFGRTFRPLQTYYPDFLWKPGEAYRETAWVSLPPRVHSGVYDLYIRLQTEPSAPVVTLSEVLSTRLGPDWLRAGEVRIGPRELPAQDQKPR
jgi:hypothetical protein